MGMSESCMLGRGKESADLSHGAWDHAETAGTSNSSERVDDYVLPSLKRKRLNDFVEPSDGGIGRRAVGEAGMPMFVSVNMTKRMRL